MTLNLIAKVVIFYRLYNTITSECAKMSRMPWGIIRQSSTSEMESRENMSSRRNDILPRLFIASFF